MSAELLRRAAKVLREHAEGATPGPWSHVDHGPKPSAFMGCGHVITDGEGIEGGEIAGPTGDLYPRGVYSPFEDMAYIALMGPPVGQALAALLDDLADSLDQDGGVVQDSGTAGAIDIARAILREPR
jgi:hypothetical protein